MSEVDRGDKGPPLTCCAFASTSSAYGNGFALVRSKAHPADVCREHAPTSMSVLISIYRPSLSAPESAHLAKIRMSDDDRTNSKAVINEDGAAELAAKVFGLAQVESVKPLNSYDDRNFYLKGNLPGSDSTQKEYVLKVNNAADAKDLIECQNLCLRHLSSKGFPCPTPQLTLQGDALTYVTLKSTGGDTASFAVRLLSYLPGQLMAHVEPHSQELLTNLGRMVGQLQELLSGFSHPAATNRVYLWDLAHLTKLRPFASTIQDKEDLTLVMNVSPSLVITNSSHVSNRLLTGLRLKFYQCFPN